MVDKDMMASFVIGTPNISRSAPKRMRGLAFRMTVKVDSDAYILITSASMLFLRHLHHAFWSPQSVATAKVQRLHAGP